jgi:precorrin-3B C17-methyltransferase
MSARAREVLERVSTVAGYATYIELIRPLIAHKQIIRTGMTREVDRVSAALDEALAGRACALVSSGDPGIYAMAGLVLELCRARRLRLRRPGAPPDPEALRLEIVPGIPALAAGAALLGAPLTHDFAAVSLSDLLTPWEVIAERLEAAARADFVIVLYNPRSRRRRDQLPRAREIVLRHRPPETPVGVVTAAMREDQQVHLTTLGALDPERVGMQTTVFIGSRSSLVYQDFIITPRGYAGKYGDAFAVEAPGGAGE